MAKQDPAGSNALRAGRTDVILVKHVHHRCARNAGDQGDIDEAEGHGRQDQMAEPWPETRGNRIVALHWQPFQTDGEDFVDADFEEVSDDDTDEEQKAS